VKQLAERAVFVSLVPVAVAAVALGVRESTRVAAPNTVGAVQVTEVLPPPVFLRSLAASFPDRALRIDPEASRARTMRADGSVVEFRADGRMNLLADGTIELLELDLRSTDLEHSGDRPALELRAVSAASHITDVPGVHACDLSCTPLAAGDDARGARLAVEWMRLPGGTIRMHAVGALGDHLAVTSWWSRVLERGAVETLGLDLVWIAAE
jgi:hypothetical protein